MAKRKATNENTAGYLAGHLQSIRDSLDDLVDCETRIAPDVGIRLPHACLRYLCRMNILPFGRFYMLYGAKRSCKSTFLFWLYDLFMGKNGTYLHIVAEDKDSKELRRAMFKNGKEDASRRPIRVNTIEQYMSIAYKYFQMVRDAAESDKAPRTQPVILGIDSLAAKLSKETIATAEREDGELGTRYAAEAKRINDFLKMAPNYVIGWPFVIVGINHDHTKPAGSGPYAGVIHHTPGGTTQGYMASSQILLKGVSDLDRTADGVEGQKIRIEVTKGSMAPTGQEIDAEFKWRFDRKEVNGKEVSVQTAWWDFDKCTTETLLAIIGAKGTRGSDLQELLGLVKKTGNKYSCRALGIAPDSPEPAAKIGEMIEADRALADKIDAILEVRACQEFNVGDDYLKFMDDDYGEDDG